MMTSILAPFLTSDKDADENIAESDHHRNVFKKLQVKMFLVQKKIAYSCTDTHIHTHTHTHTHTDMDLLLII